ncbi:MAG: hypothetical protein E6I18_08625 [Chloroflexi bacterium]|nr:MAG: hypothetical protein E6I18_08625 [Chloroflexota bacterium]
MKFATVFLVLFVVAAALAPLDVVHLYRRRERDPSVDQNERLTALAGASLYVLLVAIALTIVQLPEQLPLHYLVGFLLIPPVALKLASTGYRFTRYYLGGAVEGRADAPPALFRFIVAPLLVASTLVVFASGLELWAFGLAYGREWMTAHTVGAVVLVLSSGAHVTGHLRRSAAAVIEELRASAPHGASIRRSIVIGSLVLGLALALASLLYASPFPPNAAGA